MEKCMRLPAIPLIVNDPYFSIWCPADRLTDTDTVHWAGARKRILGKMTIDGAEYRFLGAGEAPAMEQTALTVTPMTTEAKFQAGGVQLTLRFTTPLLLDDPDIMSTPITFVDMAVDNVDAVAHRAELFFCVTDDICYDGDIRPEMIRDQFQCGGLEIAYTGQHVQKPLCHSGDHVTIDWGYLYLASDEGVEAAEDGLCLRAAGERPFCRRALIGYDDIASINYFGRLAPAWYARNGKTILSAIQEFWRDADALVGRCAVFDKQLTRDAMQLGGEDYTLITAAAYRHAVGAHKLIADEQGEMVFLSKENDSNGCIGTVDVSYPSIPLFLLYNPELVRAMCRPVLKFAMMPVWTYDFAPHDVGRYPYATGQVYGARDRGMHRNGNFVYPPYYLYPETAECYHLKYQMPVEECGNMLIMLAAASQADGDDRLARANLPLLTRWVRYLIEYGEDPGEQLCTDDFAGHLARNINLSAKALCGVAAFALILERAGQAEEAKKYLDRARDMAKSWYRRAQNGDSTYLTFDGQGWSMKYNMVWDRLFDLNLLDDSFYQKETRSYLPRINEYGLPLDSRADYTKSDWLAWSASMADEETFRALIAPIARYLRQTSTRVPFSDWYNTKTGKYEHFIARSVQGGMYMPLLMKKWRG